MDPHRTVRSDMPLDIIFPAVPKDLDVLPYAVEGAKRNIRHPVGRLYVVAPDAAAIKRFCERHGCVFVHEEAVVPVERTTMEFTVNGVDRSGWMYQQLIKLSGEAICREPFYLVIDADTVFIRPNAFEQVGKAVFHVSDEYHPPYFAAYEKLLGRKRTAAKSFITHYMLFEKSKVAELKRTVEARHRMNWAEAVLGCADRSHTSGFSDYETYGNFVLSQYPDYAVLKRWRNVSVRRSKLKETMESRMDRLARTFNTVSFHSWNR